MSKPVEEYEFWKKRIKDAGAQLHQSVFKCSPTAWKSIEISHLSAIDKYIQKNAKVLDAACGYGRLAPVFKNYTGVDFSPDFVKIAKKISPKKQFLQADLRKLPFEDDTYDWAVCSSIKRMIEENCGEEEWKLMEKELLRVSKKILILEYTEAINTLDYPGEVIERS